jgi:hypothetical protein
MNLINKKISKEFVIQDMLKRIEENAKKLWITVDEYYEIRRARKDRVKTQLNTLKNKDIFISRVSDYENIKWWLLEIYSKHNNSVIKAYINDNRKKPHIICDFEKFTDAEKNKIRKTVYWYFSGLND